MIDLQPIVTQDVCIGGTVSNTLDATYSGGVGTVSYQWYINTTSTTTGGTPIAGATNSTYTPPASTTSGNFYYYVVVTLDGVGCTGATSDVSEVVVVDDPVVDTQPITNQSLCQNAIPVNLEVVSSGGIGTFEYQWYSNTTDINSGGILISGATSSAYAPPTNTVGVLYYYVEITQLPSNLDCNVVSNTSEVEITQAPSFITQPIPSDICINEAANDLEVSYENGTGTPIYQWYSNTTDMNSGGTLITGANSAVYSPPTNNVGVLFYYCEITFSSGGCSLIVSNTAEVNVSQTPVISDYSSEVCSSLLFEFDPSTVGGNIVPSGTIYTWGLPKISPIGSVTGATSETSQAIFSQTLTSITTSATTVIYTVTPTSGICLGLDFEVEIIVNPGITADVTINNNSCSGSDNASIDVVISGGTPESPGNPYQILWDGPNGFTSTNAIISNLEPGIYTLSVLDISSCFFEMDYEITEPQELIIASETGIEISCFGYNDGEIQISLQGGSLPYIYLWTTTNGSGLIPDVKDQSGLSQGNYTVLITDANNCTVTANYEILDPTELLISEIHNSLSCFGDSNGTITINIDQESLPEYTYTISGTDYLGNPFTNSQTQPGPLYTVSNLLAGIYDIIVSDINGCNKIINAIEITQPNDIIVDVSKVDETCYGASDGSITLNISGGTPTYIYDWSDFGSGTVRTNLSAGIYEVTVTDKNNCFKTISIEIFGPEFHIDPEVRNISCFGANNGFINLNLNGGISPVSVSWDDDTSAGLERNNLSPGTYTVLVTDSNSPSCPINQSFIITEPNAIVVNGDVTNAFDCDIVASGAINLLVTGGTLPFSYSWSNGLTSEDLTNTPPGDYTVVITDVNGCEETKNFTVYRPPSLEINILSEVIANCDTRKPLQVTNVEIVGGIPPYTITWSRGTVDPMSPQAMATDEDGTVIVDVVDSYGCSRELAFNIELKRIGTPSFTFTSFGFEEYDNFSIEDPIFFTNNSTESPLGIEWNFGDKSETTDVYSPQHTYATVGTYAVTLTVDYEYGCTYSVTQEITITQGYNIIIPTAFTPNGDGINDTIRPIYFGLKSMQMSVFNTWGQLVYYEEGLGLKGWEGSIKGEDAENGNYVLAIKAKTFYGEEISLNGAITLIR
jgi:gliding motility-associated-like protein